MLIKMKKIFIATAIFAVIFTSFSCKPDVDMPEQPETPAQEPQPETPVPAPIPEQKQEYTITYVLNDGTNNAENPSKYKAEDLPITLKAPTRDGYVFIGWYETKDFSGEEVTEIAADTTGDKTFYAKWIEYAEYSITYELNSGTNNAENPSKYTAGNTVTLAKPTRTGYVFIGWYEAEDFSGEAITEIVKGTSGDKTLYAKWVEGISIDEIENKTFSNNSIIKIAGPMENWQIWDLKGKFEKLSGISGISGITLDLSGTTGLTSIDGYGLMNCECLKNVILPSSVTSIGEYAFFGCKALTSLTILGSVTSIGDMAFMFCENIDLTLAGETTGCFKDITSFKSVTMLDGVKTVDASAFSGCTGLKSVTIPSSVTSIGERAFSDCTGLTRVDASSIVDWCKINFENATANPLYYAHILYANGTWVMDLEIPDSVTYIGNYAFSGFYGITLNYYTVTIPSSVTSIGEGAFYNCTKLSSVTIPSSVTSIGSSTFSGCTKLSSVTIPSSVTSIGSSTFSGCKELTGVTIPSSVTSIGDSAFFGCTKLSSITIPSSVTSIGDYAFTGSGLTGVTIPSSITSIGGYVFQNCQSLLRVTIPSSVTSIGERAFAYCAKLSSITIPSSVTSIGERAFAYCTGLTSVTIPDSVTSIGDFAFVNCSGLTSVTFADTAGWWYASSPTATSGTSIDVGTPETNANNLKSSYSAWSNKYLFKGER